MASSPMWGTRCCGWCATATLREILLARPLLSRTQGDIAALLKARQAARCEPLKVPIKGIISEGSETIRSAVAFVFPGVPHQLCQFH